MLLSEADKFGALAKSAAVASLVAALHVACGDEGSSGAPGGSAGIGGSGGSAGSGSGGKSEGGNGNSGAGGSSAGTVAGGSPSSGGAAGASGEGGASGGEGGASAGEGGTSGGEGGASGGEGGAIGGAGGAGGGPVAPNIVFVTSESYSILNIGGIEGADAKCASLAAGAGLAGTFVAWLSDDMTNARDRIASARGWYNTHYQFFADEPAELVDSLQVYFPIRLDENGALVDGQVATGTAYATESAFNCANWTSEATDQYLIAGDPSAGSLLWNEDLTEARCDESYHLYCFQIDNVVQVAPTPTQGRTVFVSQATFTPGPGGRDVADAICAAEAAAEDLLGTFIALLGTAAEAPVDRLILPSRPWVRPDGMIVADDVAQLITGRLHTPITQRADGTYVAGQLVRGTTDLGMPVAMNCSDWTNPDMTYPSAIHGMVGFTDSRWYSSFEATCNDVPYVICAQR